MRSEAVEADVIVVGAGSSGATIAARLSEDPSRTVLVLEAGPDWTGDELPAPLRSMAPTARWADSRWADSTTKSEFFWQGVTYQHFPGEPRAMYRRGRGVGGCSIVNGCLAIRPPMSEFDDWVALGCAGWGADDVLPYFVKLEDDSEFGDAPYHGQGGPIPIRHIPESTWSALDRAFCDASLALGHPWSLDHNAPGAEGVSPFAVNIVDSDRVTTNDGYLTPARARANLQIVGDVQVDRVLFSGGRAIGVVATVNGEPQVFHADTVVLSAGAPMSPAILQRSGIGPADTLRRLGVEPVLNLPVGESMQDHAALKFWLSVADGSADAKSPEGQFGHNSLLRWSSGVADAGFNDMYLAVKNSGSVPNETVDMRVTEAPNLVGVLSQVFSRGRVTIQSADPNESPNIEHHLFSDRRDVDRARAMYKKMAEVLHEAAIDPMIESVRDRFGTPIDFSMDDAGIDQWCRKTVQHWTHVAGTCQMGDPSSATTVVDPACRVLGIEGLRVVDASVFPTVPRANNNLTAIMFGERVADLIRTEGK